MEFLRSFLRRHFTGNRWWSREMSSVFIQTNDGLTLSLKDIFETIKRVFLSLSL